MDVAENNLSTGSSLTNPGVIRLGRLGRVPLCMALQLQDDRLLLGCRCNGGKEGPGPVPSGVEKADNQRAWIIIDFHQLQQEHSSAEGGYGPWLRQISFLDHEVPTYLVPENLGVHELIYQKHARLAKNVDCMDCACQFESALFPGLPCNPNPGSQPLTVSTSLHWSPFRCINFNFDFQLVDAGH